MKTLPHPGRHAAGVALDKLLGVAASITILAGMLVLACEVAFRQSLFLHRCTTGGSGIPTSIRKTPVGASEEDHAAETPSLRTAVVRLQRDSAYPTLAKCVFLPSLPPHFPTGETPMLNAFVSLPTALQPLLAQATQPDPRAQMMSTVGMAVMMMVVVWFMIIRPQQKKAKEQAELLKTLKANDKVVTASGIIGIVTSVRDDSVTIRSGESKLEVQKSTVTQIVEKSA